MHESEKWKRSRSVVSNSSNPMDCRPPGSSVHGIFQARVLEWGAIAFCLFLSNYLVTETEQDPVGLLGMEAFLYSLRYFFL